MNLSSTALLDLQEQLEQGFQEGFAICERLPRLLHDRVAAAGPYEIETAGVEQILPQVLNELYHAMAQNLFSVLCKLEADRGGNKPINFYFWPGYASVLLKRRVYYTAEEIAGMDPRFRDVGVGLYGSELETAEEYHYSAQSRYYHYAWKQPRELVNYNPGSVYSWFRKQRPRIVSAKGRDHDLIASLTVTTSPDLPEQDLKSLDERRGSGVLSRYQFVRLERGTGDDKPTSWGQVLADKLNSEMRWYVADRSVEFPDAPGGSTRPPMTPMKKSVALSLLSLWLHSAFSDEPPAWMTDLETQLDAANFHSVREQLRLAADDEIAQRGWNRNARRARFVDWTTISLHPMLSPPALSNKESYKTEQTASYMEEHALGSAVFLSSSVLGKEFISLVRPWVRSLYGMVRNAEGLVISYNEMVRTSRSFAMIAGPWFAHEMNALLGKNTAMKAQIGNCSKQSVALRRMVLNTAQSVSSLAYFATAAVLQTNADSLSALKDKFLEPLRQLAAASQLNEVLLAVARTVYTDVDQNRTSAHKGVIPALAGEGPDARDLPPDVDFGVCFLLVNEVITNHVRHSQSEIPAEFSIAQSGPELTIRLEADVSKEELPLSKTLIYLDRLLRAFGLGEVSTEWTKAKARYATTIKVTIVASALALSQSDAVGCNAAAAIE
jgi:hypothetical protein